MVLGSIFALRFIFQALITLLTHLFVLLKFLKLQLEFFCIQSELHALGTTVGGRNLLTDTKNSPLTIYFVNLGHPSSRIIHCISSAVDLESEHT